MPELDRVDRPNLGATIDIRLFRALSLFSLRDVVGEDASKTLAYAGGKALGRRTKFKEFEEFLQWMEKKSIARTKSFAFDSEKGIGNLILLETLSSAGLTYGAANDFEINENDIDNEITIDFNIALTVDITIIITDINIQIGPGWTN